MPAVRTHSASYNAKASTSASTIKSKPKRKHHKQRAFEEKESNAAPGMQKVKAALRQTRRLLAKVRLYFFCCTVVNRLLSRINLQRMSELRLNAD